jgi:uncharacterized protein (DUF1697 family)
MILRDMTRYIALLRGINLGPSRRMAMPRLREILDEGGFEDVATYVQSGNVVLSSPDPPDLVRERIEQLVEDEFGFHSDVVIRTRDELADVIARDPFGDLVTDPKRYQVTFCAAEPDTSSLVAVEPERFAVSGREVYSWHPDGFARSKLAKATTGKPLGVATARNWNTVLKLLELAG